MTNTPEFIKTEKHLIPVKYIAYIVNYHHHGVRVFLTPDSGVSEWLEITQADYRHICKVLLDEGEQMQGGVYNNYYDPEPNEKD